MTDDGRGGLMKGAGTMLEHVSLPEAVGRALRYRILNNELPAETRLVEANLAAEFGVSRGTIRDAMRSLQAEGLIAIVPRRYSIVTRMSTQDAEDVCYARWALEDASVSQGFGDQHAELVSALRAALERMAAAAGIDLAEAVQRHRAFLDAVEKGGIPELRAAVRDHYLAGFPEHG